MPEETKPPVTASEIHLTDATGNVALILKTSQSKEGEMPASILIIADKQGRSRATLTVYDKDRGSHSGPTVLKLLDEDGDTLWDSRQPTIA